MVHTHALTTDDIRKPTEDQLTEKSTDGSRDLDTKILVGVQGLAFAIDVAQHGRGNVDGENIISVGVTLSHDCNRPLKGSLRTHR